MFTVLVKWGHGSENLLEAESIVLESAEDSQRAKTFTIFPGHGRGDGMRICLSGPGDALFVMNRYGATVAKHFYVATIAEIEEADVKRPHIDGKPFDAWRANPENLQKA